LLLINIIKDLVRHPLTKSNKLSALVRFLKWQVGSRLIPGEVIYHWVNSSKVVARTGETGITGNIYYGLHEFPDMAFLLHVLREDDLFVDVGANVGSYTVLACSAIGAKGCCFEPVPSTYARLMTNIKLNNLEDRVVSLNIALGNSSGEINFSSDLNCMNHVIADDEKVQKKITVGISTLDSELKTTPFLMKIDVEGYEMAMLEGADNTLGNEELCCVIMELSGIGHRYGYEDSKILSMMFDYGFRTYSYNPFDRSLTNLEGKQNLSEGNTLFIRNMDLVMGRLQNAPSVTVLGVSL
jgi:FkbM family methyltransferase